MLSITKRFAALPISHRQLAHKGHCAYLHGHDWVIEVEITGPRDPETGFIFDFGNFKDFRKDTLDALDHATLVQDDDHYLQALADKGIIKGYFVKDASCEGLTAHLFNKLEAYVSIKSGMLASVKRVTVWEGDKNSATITAPNK